MSGFGDRVSNNRYTRAERGLNSMKEIERKKEMSAIRYFGIKPGKIMWCGM